MNTIFVKRFSLLSVFLSLVLWAGSATALVLSQSDRLFPGELSFSYDFSPAEYSTLNFPAAGASKETQQIWTRVSQYWENLAGGVALAGLEYIDYPRNFAVGVTHMQLLIDDFPLSGIRVYSNFVYQRSQSYLFFGLNYFKVNETSVERYDQILDEYQVVDQPQFNIKEGRLLLGADIDAEILQNNTPSLQAGFVWQIADRLDIVFGYTRFMFDLKTDIEATLMNEPADGSATFDEIKTNYVAKYMMDEPLRVPVKLSIISLGFRYKIY